MRKVYFIIGVIVMGLIAGCETREDVEKPTACFNYHPTDIMAGDVVTFTNCSENTSEDFTVYKWDFGDSDESATMNPTHKFEDVGTYDVKLIVTNKNLVDEVIKEVIVGGGSAQTDPTNYDGIPGWEHNYFNEFSESGDWIEGTGEDYELSVANGYYTMTTQDVSYWITNSNIQLPEGNWDYDVKIRNTVGSDTYGSGVNFGSGTDGKNYFLYSNSKYIFRSTVTAWMGWTGTSYGNENDWNMLTVRKYIDNYYFFINEEYVGTHEYSDYGNSFGFFFDTYSTVDIDFVRISIMNLDTKKLGNIIKQRVDTPRGLSTAKLQKASKNMFLVK